MKFFLLALVALAIVVLIAVRFFRGRVPAEPQAASEGPRPPASADAGAGTRKVSDIRALTIRLDINEKPSLFVMLAADGTVNRMGTGTLENTERELFIGRIDPAIFVAVRSHVTEAMLQILGQTFQNQNPRGAPCKLTITSQFQDGNSDGFAFLYGSESEGMPQDIVNFVTAAARETDPWYENFKRTASGRHRD
jgi:hypothetical protein